MCEYCEPHPLYMGGRANSLFPSDTEDFMYITSDTGDPCLRVCGVPLFVPINYCPMCGRELRTDKER